LFPLFLSTYPDSPPDGKRNYGMTANLESLSSYPKLFPVDAYFLSTTADCAPPEIPEGVGYCWFLSLSALAAIILPFEVYDITAGSLNINPDEFGTALFTGYTLSPKIGLLIEDLMDK